MKNITRFSIVLLLISSLYGCKNRDINEGEAFRPREIHEDMVFHFDKINVDGIEYLILEKDNNNPHEGFGFMAFRANKLMEKQDSIMAYMKALYDLQMRTYAASSRRPVEDIRAEADLILNDYLQEEKADLEKLSKSSNSTISPIEAKKPSSATKKSSDN